LNPDYISVHIVYCTDFRLEMLREILFQNDTHPNVHPERIMNWMFKEMQDDCGVYGGRSN